VRGNSASDGGDLFWFYEEIFVPALIYKSFGFEEARSG